MCIPSQPTTYNNSCNKIKQLFQFFISCCCLPTALTLVSEGNQTPPTSKGHGYIKTGRDGRKCCCLPTPMLVGESDFPACGAPASFSVHLASSELTPADSVHKSRGDNVVRMWVKLKR